MHVEKFAIVKVTLKVNQGHRQTHMQYILKFIIMILTPTVWLSFELFRVIDQSVAVELEVVHASLVSRSNGIIQWTNCKLEWVYRDPVAWNLRVDPSFRPLSRCRPSYSV